MWGELHQEKHFDVTPSTKVSAGKANRLFRESGYTLHYDVYSFDVERAADWHSESIMHVELYDGSEMVDAQSSFDAVRLMYPFAHRPACDQQRALDLVELTARHFGASISYCGRPYDRATVQSDWDECSNFLLSEWGEEPGSKELARMIWENSR